MATECYPCGSVTQHAVLLVLYADPCKYKQLLKGTRTCFISQKIITSLRCLWESTFDLLNIQVNFLGGTLLCL